MSAVPLSDSLPAESLQMRPTAERRLMGAVYTPDVLAEWVASLLRQHTVEPVKGILDPASGDGALLAAAEREFPDAPSLVGIDLSPLAVKAVEAAWPGRSVGRVADTLRVRADELPEIEAVIMNPPWGAEVAITRQELRNLGYELANGQYDSWDLFLEWTVRALPPATTVAAIVPDALFLPEHQPARKLLLERTSIHVVARLGEGWFDGVFRGVAVIVYTTGRSLQDQIRCIRLPHDARRRVLAGHETLADEAIRFESIGHQMDWAADPESRFMPEGSEAAVEHLRSIEGRGGEWNKWVTSGRGVEIGKFGSLVQCVRCGVHRQPPRSPEAVCVSCGSSGSWSAVTAVSRTRPDQVERWVPLIVGEDVERYRAQSSRWLRLDLGGVEYKDERIYSRPKLLVRKTGLGLNASFDDSGSYTTQVVYHYLPRDQAPPFFLHYLEGLFCSRVLLALHLSRSGETEWRSHPYVTPKVLATLPVPIPQPGAEEWVQARAIADAAAAVHYASMSDRRAAEGKVDRLVAGLFGLDSHACAWVDSVLAKTQSLQAFSHLRSDSESLRSEVAV